MEQHVQQRHADKGESHDGEAHDRAGEEADWEGLEEPSAGSPGHAGVRARGDVHARVGGQGRERGAQDEGQGRPPAQEYEYDDHDDQGEYTEGLEQAIEIGSGPLLDRSRELGHLLVLVRLAHHPPVEVGGHPNRKQTGQ